MLRIYGCVIFLDLACFKNFYKICSVFVVLICKLLGKKKELLGHILGIKY